ncbi:MAG: terminase family protein, partial [candidate division Zixibacteria bacterium]|nr:terminase family protein [candidate division Zixibacteria bacterium]
IIHHALFRLRKIKFDFSGKYRIVTASITQDQANIIFNQVIRFINSSDLLSLLVKSHLKTPYPHIQFSNGAIIEARSTQNRGEYLLGNDYDLFIFDEVAFETNPEYVVEEIILMRLADREGKLDLVSTPNGKNWFYKRANELKFGKRKGYLQSGDSRENKYISKDFLSERLKYFSDKRIQQNIMGQFADTGGEILKGNYIDIALDGYQHLNRNSSNKSPFQIPYYMTGWDLARKKTATVGVTVKIINNCAYVVALERFKMFDWAVIIEKIKARQKKFPGRLIIDATGLGDVVVEQLKEYNPEAVIFTPSTKAELLTNLELLHAQNRVFYKRWELADGDGKIWSLEDELRQARWDKNNEFDSLMALSLAVWNLRKKDAVAIQPRIGKFR